ncbi:response regulator transcription factor [Streptomyces sp. XD-27]|uniref:helix-turn-helix transcriptional regulator n=1 Tax=Streptomyces sp. XD-27 TaxID=3062779 RepID=UPI00350E3F46
MRRGGGLPVAFGGLFAGGRQFRITELSGTETLALQGFAVSPGNGLGGKCVTMARPMSVADYRTSRAISHEYDAAVAVEGLRSVLAVPVVVRRRVRGVLYGALRQPAALGDRSLTAAVEAARELEQSLAVYDEAERLLAVARRPVEWRAEGLGPAAWEEVRAAHADLRALAQRVPDALLREEILAACGRLARARESVGRESGARGSGVRGSGVRESGVRESVARESGAGRAVELSPREVDVLACVASGATNAAAAERLGLRPETVKSYLRSAMRKLGARTRLQAVVEARRAGLLP